MSAFEYPDEAGYPDGVGTLTEDQVVLIKEVDDGHTPDFEFAVVDDTEAKTFTAIVGDTAIAGMPYAESGATRLVLLSTSVLPEYRGQGVASELIRRVLDEVRRQGKTITVRCPIVASFIQRNPGYADLIDPELPGLGAGSGK